METYASWRMVNNTERKREKDNSNKISIFNIFHDRNNTTVFSESLYQYK